jgi:hypothetical protein
MRDFRYWLPFVAFGAGLAIAVLANQVLGGTPLFSLFVLAVDLSAPIVGSLIWIRRGHSWLATLGWSVPLGLICAGIALVPGLPPFFRLGAAEICLLLGVGMIAIPEFTVWWYEKVLRASPPKWE